MYIQLYPQHLVDEHVDQLVDFTLSEGLWGFAYKGRPVSIPARDDRAPDEETITVTKSDSWYVAKDETTGVASQGETKAEALSNLAEALELHERPVSDDVDEEIESSSAPWF